MEDRTCHICGWSNYEPGWLLCSGMHVDMEKQERYYTCRLVSKQQADEGWRDLDPRPMTHAELGEYFGSSTNKDSDH